MRRPRTIAAAVAAIAGATALALSLSPASADPGGPADPPTYRVTITDLTGGQPLTPPLLTTHRGRHAMFVVGRRATPALAQIAENGNLAPMLARLARSRRAVHTAVGGAPLVPASDPGNTGLASSTTIEIEGAPGARRLSWASMLICTNDGFTGVDGLRLPARVGQTVVARTPAYDAGSEANTEDFGDLVPPCQGLIGVTGDEPGTGTSDPALATHDRIRIHPGITGREDLVPAIHGWSGPVASIRVTRID